MSVDVLEEKVDSDELDLLDLVAILLKYKWLVFGLTTIAAIGIFLYCFISLRLPVDKTYMPNMYKPQAEMLINNSSNSSSSLSSALSSSGLGGIANILGSGGSGTSNSSLASYLITSPSIQDAIIDEFYRTEIEQSHLKSIEELKKKGKYKPEDDKWVFPLMSTREMLKDKIQTDYSSSTGVFKIAVEDKDPQLACDIINYTVELLEKRFEEIGVDKNKLTVRNLEQNIDTAYRNIINLQNQIKGLDSSLANPYSYNDSETTFVMDTSMLKLELQVQEQIYSSLKTQYETMKISMASEQPVFQILEYAQIPDLKSGPSRGRLCIVFTVAVFFLSIVLSFVLNALVALYKNPVAMEKLHPKKKSK